MSAPTWDAAVIGSGVGGVVAAALLARRGRRVILLEKNDEPGGFFAGTRLADGSYFDLGIILFSGGALGGPLARLYEELQPADPPQLVSPTPLGESRSSGPWPSRVPLTADLDAFQGALVRSFPTERPALATYLELCASAALSVGGGHPPSLTLARLAASTYQSVVENHFQHPGLRGFFLDQPFFISSRFDSALIPMLRLWSLLKGDLHIAVGGTRSLIDALLHCFRRDGGELRLACPVESVQVADGRVIGVRTADGQTITCTDVVADIDVRHLLLQMLSANPGEAIRSRLAAEVAASALVCYLHLQGDPFAVLGVPGPYLSLAPGSAVDGVSAPAAGLGLLRLPPDGTGTTRLIVETRAQFPGESATADTFAATARALAEAGGARVLSTRTATPATFQLQTANDSGSTMGWAYTPRNMALNWFHPLPGLYVVSQWAGPWSGLLGGIRYGTQAADFVAGSGGKPNG